MCCNEKLRPIKNKAKIQKNISEIVKTQLPESLTNKKLEKKPSIFKLKYIKTKQIKTTKIW